MPAKHTLRYLPIAQQDLISIFDYIAQDSPNRAQSFVAKLDGSIGRLEQHPLLGRVPRHPKLREYGYRVLIQVYWNQRNRRQLYENSNGSKSKDF